MTETASGPSSSEPDRRKALIGLAVALGVALGGVGLVAGIRIARVSVDLCNAVDAGDSGCVVHPHVSEGVAVASFAVMLLIVVVLCGVVALATLGPRRAPRDRGHLLQQ